MKNLKKVLALVLAVVMIMGTVAVASAKDYKDVKSTDNYAEAIDVLSNLNILDGFGDGKFQPEGKLTRAQAAKLIAVVNNAKTTGVIKSGEEISALYENTQNYFVDCNDSWARPLINYCRIMGLADGMTATTYAPERYLTGVQWLKLMLTTLGFETPKEGYIGTGWDVNVLNRANEIGLTDGLPATWKGIENVTRGEAAQILYNALTAYLVEYGQMIKSYKEPTDKTHPWNASFVSNEQVNKTDMSLAKKMGVGLTYAHDVFMRPGYVWSYGTWTAFYLKSAVKSYTSKVSACDILVDLGYAKTSKADVEYVYYRDGRFESSVVGATISHKNNACEGVVLAGNGALTQVFKMTNNAKKTVYLITVIDTVLGKVTNVDTTKHGRPTGNSSDVTVYANTTTGSKYTNATVAINVPSLTEYAKNDYVLFNAAAHATTVLDAKGIDTVYAGIFEDYGYMYKANTKVWDNTNKGVYATAAGGYYVVPLQKAETIAAGTFTGRSLPDMDVLTVNGEKYNANCTYTLDTPNTPTVGAATLTKAVLDFYVDQYGNLIGDVKPADAAKAYGVLDGIYWTTAGTVYTDTQYAAAGLAKAGEDAVTNITAATYGSAALKGTSQNLWTGTETDLAMGQPTQNTVSVIKANNAHYVDAARKYGVVSYATYADGTYDVTAAGVVLDKASADDNVIDATKPYVGTAAGVNYYADETTIFMVRTQDANKANVYKSYTGIKNVPSIRAAKAVVAVKETDKAFCSFVFIDATDAIFANSTSVAFVAQNVKPEYEEVGVKYSYFNVYINGVKTTVEVAKTLSGQTAADMFKQGVGMYALSFDSNGKLIKATKLGDADGYVSATVKSETGTTTVIATKTADNTEIGINAEAAKVYIINETLSYASTPATSTAVEVVEGTFADIAKGDSIIYKLVGGSSWMAETIYVYRAN